MLGALRQCRTLAVALLLAVPGLGGTWLTLAHPCPVDMPWLAPSGHGGHGAESSHGHDDAPPGSTSSCNCVGACQSVGVALNSIPAGPTVIAAVAGWNPSPSTPDTDSPVRPWPHRQPPATAPPLA
jgi:hypothetical protein